MSLGSVYSEEFTLGSGAGLLDIVRTIDVSSPIGPANLVFDHAGGDNLGLLLDDVVLQRLTPRGDVPVPGSLALLGLGLTMLALGRRRPDQHP